MSLCSKQLIKASLDQKSTDEIVPPQSLRAGFEQIWTCNAIDFSLMLVLVVLWSLDWKKSNNLAQEFASEISTATIWFCRSIILLLIHLMHDLYIVFLQLFSSLHIHIS